MSEFIYRPENNLDPIATDCTVSEALKEYHKNSRVQINISKELMEELIKEINIDHIVDVNDLIK